jgi:hypothetical protein
LKWRYFDNLAPLLAYRLGRGELVGEAARVLAELNRNGVAITSVESLLGARSCYPELEQAAERLQRDLAERIAAAKEAANRTDEKKTYLIALLGRRPLLDAGSIYARFALQPNILGIVNAYFGMYTQLRFYNVWHNLVSVSPARNSQLWHRDPEDRHVLKVFVYLSDVDPGAGPFTYAAGSHPKGGLRRQPAYTRTEQDRARRSDDAQMAEVVPPERWVQATGPRGTVVFADTRGYHKGGLARERERLLYVCMFTSQASKHRKSFVRRDRISAPLDLDQEQAFALGR